MDLMGAESVLLVEAMASRSRSWQSTLEKAGLVVTSAFSGRAALSALRKQHYGLVLLDPMLPDANGLDLMCEIHARSPATRVIVVAANGSIDRAIEAIRRGAVDFLVSPVEDRRLLRAIRTAMTSPVLTPADRGSGSDAAARAEGIDNLIGSSGALDRLRGLIGRVARSTATVFITGESGTGKELAARAIHGQSARQAGPFIVLNCGGMPADLLEPEMFGHLEGAVSGALSGRTGAVAAADGGTLFLDGVCELDPALQARLLRFLQASTVRPVGAVEPGKADVRIMCATHRDPLEEVRAGRFRADLYHRLHVLPVHVPPLRARGHDVIEIAETLIARVSAEEGKAVARLSDQAARALLDYHWPGNVRQLENVLRNAVVVNDGTEITLVMLPGPIVDRYLAVEGAREPCRGDASPDKPHDSAMEHPRERRNTRGDHTAPTLQDLAGETLADVERQFIEITIADCEGSVPQAARVLGLSPSTLYRKRQAWDHGEETGSEPVPGPFELKCAKDFAASSARTWR